jgi:P-type Ca2+ transporter type 2C
VTQPTPTRTPPVPSDGTPASDVAWHTLPADEVLERTGADLERGLSSAEAEERLRRFGANQFTAATSETRIHAFLRQYADPMQVVLLVAGIGSLYPLKEVGTGILLLLLTVFNAVLGLRQEGKAAAAVAALQKMMIIKARVTRDGQLAQLPAE